VACESCTMRARLLEHLCARAALVASRIGEPEIVCDVYHIRQEIDRGNGTVVVDVRAVSHLDGLGEVVEVLARAATLLSLVGNFKHSHRSRAIHRSASGFVAAIERALRLGAGSGLAAGPRALGGRASGSAVGDGRGAHSLALGGQADVLAKRAATRLAVLSGAADLALGLLAADIASSLAELLAS